MFFSWVQHLDLDLYMVMGPLTWLWFLVLAMAFGFGFNFCSVESRKYVDSMLRVGGFG